MARSCLRPRNNPHQYMSVDTDALAVELCGLDREEIGVFIKIRVELWRRDAPLPDDDAAIASAIGEDVRVIRRMRPRLAPMFIVEGGTWRDRQVERAKAFATKCRGEQSRVRPKNSPDLFGKPLKAAASGPCKREDIEPKEGGSMWDAPKARQAPPAPETEPPLSAKIRDEGEARSRSRPRHSSWRKGKALDPAWEPDQSGRAYAYERGHDDEWIDRQVQRFHLHYRSRGATRSNWQDQWCLWVEDTPQFAARGTFETRDERNKAARHKTKAGIFYAAMRYCDNATSCGEEPRYAIRG